MSQFWAWAIDEEMHGLFDSREDAEADCREYVLDQQDEGTVLTPRHLDSFRVFEAEKIDPAHWIAHKHSLGWIAEMLLERADELLQDTACFDEPTFLIQDDPKAEAALRDLLTVWAKEHVTSNGHWCMKEGAMYLPVRLGPDAAALVDKEA